MDTLTHALSGALLARATAPAKSHPGALTPKARMAAGFAAAAFPDCDFALRLVDTLTYLNWHQGITHSLLLMPVWAWLLAHLFSWIAGGRYRWQAFYGAALLGIAIHIAGDLITAYGTMLFAPLSTQRFSFPLAFVIDPYLTAIVAGGIAVVMLRPQSRRPAVIALILLVGYAALLATLYFRAIDIGRDYVATHQLGGAAVHALPQPLAPFNWKIIVAHDEGYYEALVNLWRSRPHPAPAAQAGTLQRIFAAYQPVSMQNWQRHPRFSENPSYSTIAREAWNQEAFAGFRRFAVFPAVDRVDISGDQICVWFYDLRFSLPSLAPSFRYGMCRSGSLVNWRLTHMPGSFWID